MIVTWLYIDRRTRNPFLHTYIFVDLRSGSTLCCSLDNPSHDRIVFLSVGEGLNAEDFKFPVFLLDGYDGDSIVWERGPGSGLRRCGALGRSYRLRPEIK